MTPQKITALEARVAHIESLLHLVPKRPLATLDTAAAVIQAVSDHTGVATTLMHSRNRAAPVAWARQLAMYIMRIDYGLTLAAVGTIFQRDHGTVTHAITAVENLIDSYPREGDAIDRLRETIRASLPH